MSPRSPRCEALWEVNKLHFSSSQDTRTTYEGEKATPPSPSPNRLLQWLCTFNATHVLCDVARAQGARGTERDLDLLLLPPPLCCRCLGIVSVALRATTQTTTMGYIPQHALDNLKKYSYKGVDKCVIASSPLSPMDSSPPGRSYRDMSSTRSGPGLSPFGRRGSRRTPYVVCKVFSRRPS